MGKEQDKPQAQRENGPEAMLRAVLVFQQQLA
jgi:hypothetical protein